MLMYPMPIPDVWLAAPSNGLSGAPVPLAVADGLCVLKIVEVPFTLGVAEVAARGIVPEL